MISTDTDVPGESVERVHEDILKAVRSVVKIPVAVKIGPYFSSLANMAGRLAEAGADGLVLFNRFYQPDIDIEALDAASRTAQVVGVNGLDEAIDNVEKGRMLATVDFSAFKICHFAAEAALRHVHGEKVPREIVVPTALIDRANVADWKLPVERRSVPRWESVVR